MKLVTRTQRVIIDAAIEVSVIRGTLTGPSGARRAFHRWLALSTSLEKASSPGMTRARRSRLQA
jgi:hypothetical protein